MASPSAYWNNVVTELKIVEDEAIETQYYLEEAIKSKKEARLACEREN